MGAPEAWRGPYKALLARMRRGECIPMYYEPLSYEWIENSTLDRALEIASVYDEAICVKKLAPAPLLLLLECLSEAQRVAPEIGYPGFEIVTNLQMNPDLVDWFTTVNRDPDEAPTVSGNIIVNDPTVCDIIRSTFPVLSRGMCWSHLLDGEREALAKTRETQASYGQRGLPPAKYKRNWLRTGVRLHKYVNEMAPHLQVEDVLEAMDLSRCPAVSLKVDTYWQYARANKEPQRNDAIDLTLIAPQPYVDFSLIERRLAGFVEQSPLCQGSCSLPCAS